MIDLRTCKPGDKLRLRNGAIATYRCEDQWPHVAIMEDESIFTCRHDGGVWSVNNQSEHDIIEIIGQPAKAE